MGKAYQKTLGRAVVVTGTGLHSGRPVRMEVRPAVDGNGIHFYRTDIDSQINRVPAIWSNVVQEPLNTRLVNGSGVSIATVEHLMAAFAGLGVSNADVYVSGPEIPILDGSSREFVQAFLWAGIVETSAPLQVIEILKTVTVERGCARATLSPADRLSISFEIDFDAAAIGHQRASFSMENGQFLRQMADCRTFCLKTDIEKMHDAGLALGGTYDNAVVLDGSEVVTPGGLRRSDEPVRHKMLDALGDLALAGAPIVGAYEGVRAGHALTNALLRALFSDEAAFRLVGCPDDLAGKLPGAAASFEDLRAVA